MKCTWMRGFAASHALTVGVLVRGVVVLQQLQVASALLPVRCGGVGAVDLFQEREKVAV